MKTSRDTNRNGGNDKELRRSQGSTDEERNAMSERIKELKAEKMLGIKDLESAVLSKIDGVPEPDREIVSRIHKIIKEVAPDLSSRLLYGMPAYSKDGKVICFFQPASKFKARYSTLGFSDKAYLDEGSL